MSRLTDLISQVKARDADLGKELEREFKRLSSRLPFGLNFERHIPESVELPGRPVRKGDKVRVLPDRGTKEKGDKRLYRVLKASRGNGTRMARIECVHEPESENCEVPVDDLVVVAEFRDYIYPGLMSTGKVTCGGDKPFHTVINAENFHALEALTFTHRGKIDAIYIDPPYNTGAKDWKYNNDYVESEDIYRHSKWLAMVERRLFVARELLNPADSVLIVTIDEKEYLRTGLLLAQVFPEARIQMVTSVIKPEGVPLAGAFSRSTEYIYFLRFGRAVVNPEKDDSVEQVPWNLMQRREDVSQRGGPKPGPDQFYPIYVERSTNRIVEIGAALPDGVDRSTASSRAGCDTVFPLRPDGQEMSWSLATSSAKALLAKGFLFAEPSRNGRRAIKYLTSGKVAEVESGSIEVLGYGSDGRAILRYTGGKATMPTTAWNRPSHNPQTAGTKLLTQILGARTFPFPKSLYAVEDALRFFVANKPDAVVLDFFSGSGTTAHAVMRLNKQDGGRRQCISVTNNEVAANEQKKLREQGLRPGDPDWEKWGICDYITKPRIAAAITGKTPEGEPIKGNYKFTDEFPMAYGFEENAEFFTLTYEAPVAVHHNHSFRRIAPLLWMRAGSAGRRIDEVPEKGWDVAKTYGLLTDLDQAATFRDAVEANNRLRIAYIVTDDERRFQAVAQRLPHTVEAVRLYEAYLTNFRFSLG